MSERSFTHLHTHTEFSMLDGAARVGDLVAVSGRHTVLGTSESRHDLSGLDAPLRSHGGVSEQEVPLVFNRVVDVGGRSDLRNFDALGVKLLRGRDFTQEECEKKDARRVAIIDEQMAKKLFPKDDAIGQHVRYTIPPKDGSPNDIEIVGIVNTHRHDVQNETTLARLFVPFAQGYTGNVFLHVKLTAQDRRSVAGMIPTVRSTFREIDPDLPLVG